MLILKLVQFRKPYCGYIKKCPMVHGELDPRYQNLLAEYICENCGTKVNPPRHCGHPMHLERLNEDTEWVCWMGASCGHSGYKACCNSPSIPVFETVNP